MEKAKVYRSIFFILLAFIALLLIFSLSTIIRTRKEIREEHTFLEGNSLAYSQSLNRLVFRTYRLLTFQGDMKTAESAKRTAAESAELCRAVVSHMEYVEDIPALFTDEEFFTDDPLFLADQFTEYQQEMENYFTLLTEIYSRIKASGDTNTKLTEIDRFRKICRDLMLDLENKNYLLSQLNDYILAHIQQDLLYFTTIMRIYIFTHSIITLILIGISILYMSFTRKSRKELLKSRDILEEKVRERTEELSRKHSILEKALEEKDILMREIHHRVKNNLAMVSSLITLQEFDEVADEAVCIKLENLSNQIHSIEAIHEMLHNSDNITGIHVRDYIMNLLRNVFSMSSAHIDTEITITPDYVHSRKAVPLGLIINEIATNTVKYGASGTGYISFFLEMIEEDNGFVLTMSNTGAPLPAEISLKNPGSLGLRLVSALTEQLKGTVEVIREPHPVFIFRFPNQ